ncbi:MAG: S9 family peptidase [Kangiellaceae bacterium]|nr:S9 family peptidase [Kangiellaceae bacterium]
MKTIEPYGRWPSTITAQSLASKSTRLGQIHAFNGNLYWLENRPHEQGRGVIVCFDGEHKQDVTSSDYNVRTRVHEYGGADFWLNEQHLIFADDSNQQLIIQNLSTNQARELTALPPSKRAWRYNDGQIAPNGQYTVCVRERHQGDVFNELISIDLTSGQVEIIAQGADFYSNPRISSNGQQICWLQWSHPNMPWDQTELWLADIDKQGRISNARALVNTSNVSVYNPQWSVNGKLYYVADNNGWWHIYDSETHQPIHEYQEIEFGLPQWVFGCNTYQFVSDSKAIAIGTKQGQQALYEIELDTQQIKLLTDNWTAFSGQFAADAHQLYFTAASPTQGEAIWRYGLIDHSVHNLTSLEDAIEQTQEVSIGEHIAFEASNQQTAYGYFYRPTNAQFEAPEQELPPLIVMSHGGPTGMTDNGYNQQIQYWTSRGFAVADVNYRGSTGYGRAYRDSLKGNWGLFDVQDCIAMAQHLADKGLVDVNRMAIRGGSAGGLTTLCALTFHNVFKAGMSRYGVADLVSLASDSHKFEIRYLDSMVGPLPQALETYKARSPIEHTEKLSCPILILQGLEDKVVPPSQAQAMVKALEEKGLPYEYIAFEGEGHGFRKPETIIRAFEAEFEFYKKYLLQ